MKTFALRLAKIQRSKNYNLFFDENMIEYNYYSIIGSESYKLNKLEKPMILYTNKIFFLNNDGIFFSKSDFFLIYLYVLCYFEDNFELLTIFSFEFLNEYFTEYFKIIIEEPKYFEDLLLVLELCNRHVNIINKIYKLIFYNFDIISYKIINMLFLSDLLILNNIVINFYTVIPNDFYIAGGNKFGAITYFSNIVNDFLIYTYKSKQIPNQRFLMRLKTCTDFYGYRYIWIKLIICRCIKN